MGMYLNSKEEGPTFEEIALGLMNTRTIGIQLKSRDFIREEMGHPAFSHIYAVILLTQNYSKAQLNNLGELPSGRLTAGKASYFDAVDGYGEIVKLTNTRLQIKASSVLKGIVENSPYVRSCPKHRGSLLVPVGCSGWPMLLTIKDDLYTFDRVTLQADPVKVICIKRAFLEPLRRVLRSRNQFQPFIIPGGKMGFTLQKSSLTLGSLDHLAKDWRDAILERIDEIYINATGNTSPFSDITISTNGSRYDRTFNIVAELDDRVEMPIARVTLLDKMFFLEI